MWHQLNEEMQKVETDFGFFFIHWLHWKREKLLIINIKKKKKKLT